MPVVFITVKNVFGVLLYYPDPANITALLLARLICKKTFNTQDIRSIRALGFEIQYTNAYADAQV